MHVPRSVQRYMDVPMSIQRYVHVPRSVQRYVHIPEQTYLIHKFIKFRGCLEAASERTNVPLSSARTWTPFHHRGKKAFNSLICNSESKVKNK